jgi:hypothetical protein
MTNQEDISVDSSGSKHINPCVVDVIPLKRMERMEWKRREDGNGLIRGIKSFGETWTENQRTKNLSETYE